MNVTIYNAHDLVHHEDKLERLRLERNVIVKQLEVKEFDILRQKETVSYIQRKVLK